MGIRFQARIREQNRILYRKIAQIQKLIAAEQNELFVRTHALHEHSPGSTALIKVHARACVWCEYP